MKKAFFSIIVCMLTACYVNAQERIVYHDAVYLQNVLKTNNNKFIISVETKKVLDYYFGNIGQAEMAILIQANPFLNPYYTPPGISANGFNALSAPNFQSSIGNTDVTNFADGIAKFIVERTKKELQDAFFDRFIELVEKPEYKDIQTLFPVTYNIIRRMPDDVYDYKVYIQTIREAFGKDLQNLLPNLENVLKNGQYKNLFDSHKELNSVCLTALYFANGFRRGDHVGSLLEQYVVTSPDYVFTDANANSIKNNALLFVQEVSKSFKNDVSGKEYWIPAPKIKGLANDKVLLDLYLGLLYQRVKDLEVYTGGKKYGDLLTDAGKAKDFIYSLAIQVENIQTLRDKIEKTPADKQTVDDYISYFNATTQFISFFKDSSLITEMVDNIGDANEKETIKKFWKNYDEIIEGTDALTTIYYGIKEKNYSIVISNVKTLYEIRYDPSQLTHPGDKKKVEDIIRFLLEKGAFIAGVAEAKNSDEVYEAINRVAMPSGSSRVKRLARANVAVNAYCGLFAGYEKIHGLDKKDKAVNTYGLTAPVGISFSWGNRIAPKPFPPGFNSKDSKGWSSSWFVSIIDVGAVAAYRFENNIAEQVPTIQLKDIFSPGLFWSVGIPKTPVSLNLGAQVGPNLRKVNDTENDYSKNTYIRYSFSVCIDIPVINLHTKTD